MFLNRYPYQGRMGRMDFGRDKMRTVVKEDRLSSLPNDLIHKILSFVDITCAIATSSLSSRWRFIWTSIPYLNFYSAYFRTLPMFSKFVTNVLSHRNNQIEVSSVNLHFRGKVSQVFVKKIMDYAFSHNVQQLFVTCSFKEKSQFPLSLFISQSLKHLTLTNDIYWPSISPTLTWDLPALTTLHVSHITFSDDNIDKCLGLLSKCVNLKNLTLEDFSMNGSDVFIICHTQLSNLTLKNDGRRPDVIINVVAPQLENLTIIRCSAKFSISAPDLSSLLYEGNCPSQFWTGGFHSLGKVNLCFCYIHEADACKIVSLLQEVHSAKFLSLNLEIVEFLSSYPDLLSHQPFPFSNLKSLKIYPYSLFDQKHKKVTMSPEVRNYLLDNSPSATFVMVSREEARAGKDAKLAQKRMADLQVLLERNKAKPEAKMARIGQGKAPIKSHKTERQVQGRAQLKIYWAELERQIQQGKAETDHILSGLSGIEKLLANLPTLRRAELQARFDRLCAKSDAVMKNIVDCKKIQCDYIQTHLNVNFQELSPASQPSPSEIVPPSSRTTSMQSATQATALLHNSEK